MSNIKEIYYNFKKETDESFGGLVSEITDYVNLLENEIKRRPIRILHLTIKKEYFDMISSGIKKEEYRDIKDYYRKRLKNKDYDIVRFRNGYNKNSPVVDIEYLGYKIGFGNIFWGAEIGKSYYVIKLGKIITEAKSKIPCTNTAIL